MEALVRSLQEIDGDTELAMVGGKALNLAKMFRAGFPVPPALAVTVDAYDEFLSSSGLRERISSVLAGIDFQDEESLRNGSQMIQGMIAAEPMPVHLETALTERIPILGGGYFAVRSSAVAEDLPEASFAGQQDSYLNVSPTDVASKTALCWASYWNERAMKYRHDSRVPQLETGMAVVVQRMVDSDSSGIMFTRNPLNGSDEIVVESSWGLGESIASGLVTPDRFILHPGDHRLLDSQVSEKCLGCFRQGAENVWQDLDSEKANIPSLQDDQLMSLASWAERLEDFFQSPQDVEWAFADGRFFILQSRPITTVAEDDGDDILWTRAYGDEYWADVTSPLFFSVMGEMLTEIVNHEGAKVMGYNDITEAVLLRMHRSHVYFNAEVLEKVFSYYPRFARSSELLNYFPVQDQERIQAAKSSLTSTLMSQVLVAIRDPDGMMNRTDKAYRRWADSFLSLCQEFDSVPLEQLSDQELNDWFDAIVQGAMKHYRLIRYGMVSHSIATNLAVKQWLRAWLDDQDGELYSRVISGLPGNKTIQTNIGFSELAKIIRSQPDALNAFQERATPELIRDLTSDPVLGDVNQALQSFLQEFGHRSHTREIFFPRWKEDITQVVDVLRTLSLSDLDLAGLETKKRQERVEYEKEILERIASLPGGALRMRLFRTVLRLAQTYLVFRENQRFYLDHILFRQRLVFLEYGRRLETRGHLEKAEDVFFLTKEEVFDIINGERPSSSLDVQGRRMEFMRNRNTLPPKFLRRRLEFDDSVVRSEDASIISGTSASPGICTGPVRVVGSIKGLSGIKAGEILVTSNTDPGWTAVFSKLGGLITETGGILSHGAVVSREYGIPAVTAVKNATSLLCTGQIITLDGNRGCITIHHEDEV